MPSVTCMEPPPSSLLGEDGLEFGQWVADDRAARLYVGAADRALERERRRVAGADGRAPFIPAGESGANAIETGRREPGDFRPPGLVPVAAQYAGAAQALVLGEGELDAVLAFTKDEGLGGTGAADS